MDSRGAQCCCVPTHRHKCLGSKLWRCIRCRSGSAGPGQLVLSSSVISVILAARGHFQRLAQVDRRLEQKF